ncbi:MAG: hypothetical protein M1826_004972 [Phylliscum demangeonii]|nr:MAG: hypothetical protein M1826_004972 [Phylliscum demangeonii]
MSAPHAPPPARSGRLSVSPRSVTDPGQHHDERRAAAPPGPPATGEPSGRPNHSSSSSHSSRELLPLRPAPGERTHPSVVLLPPPPPLSLSSPSRPTPPAAPSIRCRRCGAAHIEHELHYHCPPCSSNDDDGDGDGDGDYSICLSCYRLAKGCKHWYGFGSAARIKYERLAPAAGYPPGHAPPHVLLGRRYVRPRPSGSQADNDHDHNDHDHDPPPPQPRVQTGVFCALCRAWANALYWQCDVCNDGEWGFCGACVNSGRCCTHPLLPLHAAAAAAAATAPPPLAALAPPPLALTPLTIHTDCNICHQAIQPSSTRFHCGRCHRGNYDICTACYLKLGSQHGGPIAVADGAAGWRRCLRRHRMIVLGFEDRDDGGRKRVVVADRVGGCALRDDDEADDEAEGGPEAEAEREAEGPHEWPTVWSWREGPDGQRATKAFALASASSTTDETTTTTMTATATTATKAALSSERALERRGFPPDGGAGMHVLALWSHYPEPDLRRGGSEGAGVVAGTGTAAETGTAAAATGTAAAAMATDELMFPRGALIREVQDVNGDWYWGCYAGRLGLFPAGYVRVVRGP